LIVGAIVAVVVAFGRYGRTDGHSPSPVDRGALSGQL
jgi:hypothetical protein